jgi:hypothetical protein
MSSYFSIFIMSVQLIFGIIFLIFSGWMLNDQWSIINNDTMGIKKFINMKLKNII